MTSRNAVYTKVEKILKYSMNLDNAWKQRAVGWLDLKPN